MRTATWIAPLCSPLHNIETTLAKTTFNIMKLGIEIVLLHSSYYTLHTTTYIGIVLLHSLNKINNSLII